MSMYFPPAPFDLDEAVLCARLVVAAYDMSDQWEAQDKPRHAERFTWKPQGPDFSYSAPVWGYARLLKIFREPAPFAFVAWQGASAYVVFRGTQTPSDGIEDLRARQKVYPCVDGFGDAHEGFVDVYETISVGLRQAVNDLPASVGRLVISGHSMGSALSTLAVPDLLLGTRFGASQVTHYNLASPRVGAPSFVERYAASGVPTYRVVNDSDLVTEVPPPVFGDTLYQHVGIPISFNVQNGSITGNHSAVHVYLKALEDALQLEA